MCSEERYSECTGGLWRPRIGVSALVASYRGRVGMPLAQDHLKMRFNGRTKKFRVWTKSLCRRATHRIGGVGENIVACFCLYDYVVRTAH
jgi:hypothetical protein